jgi:hypothetical protein
MSDYRRGFREPEPLPTDPFGVELPSVALLYKATMLEEPLTPEEQAQWDAYEKAQAAAVARRDRLGVVDLAEVMELGVQKPAMLVPDLLVEGKHHLIYGAKEVSKTWIVLWIIGQLLSQGLNVVYVDKESGKGEIAERLAALGVSIDAVREHLTYLEFPSFDCSSESKRLWEALLTLKEPVLSAFDAHTEFLADAGANENSGTDLEKWAQAYLTPAHRVGCATLMIDHVGHNEQERSRGTGQKGNAAKVELLVKNGEEFHRSKVGSVTITRTKNTPSADIPKTQAYEIGGEEGRFVFRKKLVPDEDPKAAERAEREDYAKAKIVKVLEAQGPMSQGQLATMVGGRKTATLQVMQDLAQSSLSRVTMKPKGNSFEYSLEAVTDAASS